MKAAVCVEYSDNSAKISDSFSRSDDFLIYSLNEERMIEKITNHIKYSAGSEVFSAQLLIKKGINVVVCGRCETNAKNLFSLANITIIENIHSNPGEFVNELYYGYKQDKLVSFEK
jgi:predicted Fe-Mo cluster-binding NifX family protein